MARSKPGLSQSIHFSYNNNNAWVTILFNTFIPIVYSIALNFIIIVTNYIHEWHAYNHVHMQCDMKYTHSCYPKFLQSNNPLTLSILLGTPEALHHCLQQKHVYKQFSCVISQYEDMYTTTVRCTLMQSTPTAVTLSAYG